MLLAKSVFTALTGNAGVQLAANEFFVGTAAHDADDRIIYNASTGALIYDSNGNVAGGAVQFATLESLPTLSHTSFLLAWSRHTMDGRISHMQSAAIFA